MFFTSDAFRNRCFLDQNMIRPVTVFGKSHFRQKCSDHSIRKLFHPKFGTNIFCSHILLIQLKTFVPYVPSASYLGFVPHSNSRNWTNKVILSISYHIRQAKKSTATCSQRSG